MQPNNDRELHAIESAQRRQDALTLPDNPFVAQLRVDAARIDDILATDPSLTSREKHELYEMGVNTQLDWLYAEQGGKQLDFTQFDAEAKHTAAFITEAERHASDVFKVNPAEGWSLRVKGLDLLAYRAHRALNESQTTLQGTESAEKVRLLANNGMKAALGQAVRLMKEMEPHAHGEGRFAQDTRGQLYELMMTTYARWQTFDREDFDDKFVRTALSREDRPWNGYADPKRSFDIVIEEKNQPTRFLQTKNYNNGDDYAYPIEKVMDTRFGRTLHDLRKYTTDFSLLISNPSDPHLQQRLRTAGDELDAVFGAQLAHESVVV